MRASYSYGYSRNNRRIERWSIFTNPGFQFVQIDFDPDWFKAEGSINDLKTMAVEPAVPGGP